MTRTLYPCPHCDRHALATETVCPFCKQAFSTALSRRALGGAALSVSLGALVAACDGDKPAEVPPNHSPRIRPPR